MSLFVYLQSGLVAVGTHKGLVQIWDAGAQKRVSTIEGHTARVGKQAKFTVSTIFYCLKQYQFYFVQLGQKRSLACCSKPIEANEDITVQQEYSQSSQMNALKCCKQIVTSKLRINFRDLTFQLP